LRDIKIRDYTFGLVVTIVGLGLYSYYVRELLAALTLFSVAFFFLVLVGLSALLVCSASVQVAIWASVAERDRVFPPSDRSLRKALSREDISRQNRRLCTSEQTGAFASSRMGVEGLALLAREKFRTDRSLSTS
jgi:hypothetical protein